MLHLKEKSIKQVLSDRRPLRKSEVASAAGDAAMNVCCLTRARSYKASQVSRVKFRRVTWPPYMVTWLVVMTYGIVTRKRFIGAEQRGWESDREKHAPLGEEMGIRWLIAGRDIRGAITGRHHSSRILNTAHLIPPPSSLMYLLSTNGEGACWSCDFPTWHAGEIR